MQNIISVNCKWHTLQNSKTSLGPRPGPFSAFQSCTPTLAIGNLEESNSHTHKYNTCIPTYTQCGPRIWTPKGGIWSKTEATPTLLMIGIYCDTIFHQKCNYCGMLSRFWRDEGSFKALCKGFSDSFEGFHSLQKRPSDFPAYTLSDTHIHTANLDYAITFMSFFSWSLEPSILMRCGSFCVDILGWFLTGSGPYKESSWSSADTAVMSMMSSTDGCPMGDMDRSSSLTQGMSWRASNLVSLADLACSVVEPENKTLVYACILAHISSWSQVGLQLLTYATCVRNIYYLYVYIWRTSFDFKALRVD